MQERVVTPEEAIAAMKQTNLPKALEIRVNGELLAEYDALCEECLDIVLHYADSASKKLEKKSTRRSIKRVEAKEAVPAPGPKPGPQSVPPKAPPPPQAQKR